MMYYLFQLILIPTINALVTVEIHRNSLYDPQSPCAFIRNASLSNDASIQSCIWECVHEQNCQTAVYHMTGKICSMFAEAVKNDRIQSSNRVITCPSSTTFNEEETTTTLETITTTTENLSVLTGTNEDVFGVWNTTAGQNSADATPGYNMGNYVPGETPAFTFDRNISTKYLSFGICNSSTSNMDCGLNTGFYLTLKRGPSLLQTVQICTADDFKGRIPVTMTVEGSNETLSALTLGSSWTLIYNGTTGLDNGTQPFTYGLQISIPNNSIWYSSYRLLITSKCGIDNSVQYSEIELRGH